MIQLTQVCQTWRCATDIPYVWRRLCQRRQLLVEGEEEELADDDQLEEDHELEEESEETKKNTVAQELSFWARIYRTRSAARLKLSKLVKTHEVF